MEAVFVALKADVEALFMTAPSVSLAELAQEVADAHRHVDSQVRPLLAHRVGLGSAWPSWRRRCSTRTATSTARPGPSLHPIM